MERSLAFSALLDLAPVEFGHLSSTVSNDEAGAIITDMLAAYDANPGTLGMFDFTRKTYLPALATNATPGYLARRAADLLANRR